MTSQKNSDDLVQKKKIISPLAIALKTLALLSITFVILTSVLSWACWTQSGTQTALQLSQWLSGDLVKLSGVSGSLADEVHIDELSFNSQKIKLLASGIKLVWQPSTLLHGKLVIDNLELSALRIASVADTNPVQLPADLRLPLPVTIKNAALGRLNLATLQKDGSELPTLQLSALTAQLDSSQTLHVLSGGLTSPWGKLHLQGQIANSKPYALQATFDYHGQANKAIPDVAVNGVAQGSLAQISVAAQAISESNGDGDSEGDSEGDSDAASRAASKSNKKGEANLKAILKGGFSAMLMPFSAQPFRTVQANIQGLNPADFSADAPQANLQVHANLQTVATSVSDANIAHKTKVINSANSTDVIADVMSGSIAIENSKPGRLDQNAIPLISLRSDVRWSDTALQFTNATVRVSGNGKLIGQANVKIVQKGLPLVDANFKLDAINLAQLDSRIRPTQIAGLLHAEAATIHDEKKPDNTVVKFQAQLQDPRASLKVDAHYQTNFQTQNQNGEKSAKNSSILRLNRFELIAADSHVQGKGEIDFSDAQKFNLQADVVRFDPSRWMKLPAGHIDANVQLTGQLKPRLILNLELPHVSGDYAGQILSGAADASWQEGVAIYVKKMDLHWGKNTLNAQGAWGKEKDELLLALDVPDLPAFSHVLGMNLAGAMQADVHVHGALANPAIKMNLQAQGVGIEKQIYLDKLTGTINLGSEKNAVVNADILVQELRSNLAVAEKNRTTKLPLIAERLALNIKGTRDVHQIDLLASLNAARQFTLSATGGLPAINGKAQQWRGQIASLNLSGEPGLALQAPVQISVEKTADNVKNKSTLHVGSAQLTGALGKVALDEFEWTPAGIKTRGKLSDVKIVDVANLFNPQYAIEGDLLVNADWDVQLKDYVRGELHLQRLSGDIRINDVDGTGQAMAMGLSDLQMRLNLGGLIAGSDAERVALQVSTSGTRLGIWSLNANSQLRKNGAQWKLFDEAKLAGDLHADVQDLQWLGPWINPGLALKGKLKLDASLSGVIGKPQYQAQIEGRELEVAFASEGVLLPNGSLSAELDEKHVKLNQLKFSNKVSVMPKHAKFRDINWLGQTGEFTASGEIDMAGQSGSISAEFQKFPLLQRKDRWLVVSGQTQIKQQNNKQGNIWALTGQLIADGAYFKLPKTPPPSLSGDVVVNRGKKKNGTQEAEPDPGRKGLKTRLDVTLDMGPQFVFVGSGLDTGLAGTVRLRSNDGSALQATGSIRAEDGIYEGYGQKLVIERGILNFQGSPSNPGLNILALRKGLEVEAGVEVVGTVSSPKVHLVSEPSVPDAEKLSWLVLGTGTADIASNQASVLLSAAGAIFGDDSGRNIPRNIVQGLGFDEFSVGSAETGSSKLPGQTVAGSTAVGTASGDQVLSIGKRLRPGLVISVERGLSDASGALKLSWQLSRRISIIARKGTEGSVDAYYTFSFH
ncbi:MAG: translocation/assembly module TamB domain-containing protein [Pseudomonadota bacterium]